MTISGADRGAIMDLQARYVHLYDSGDFEGWIQCFAEDGIYEAPTLADQVVGHSALRKLASTLDRKVPIRTLPSTQTVDGEGDSATMFSFFMVLQLHDPPKMITAGRFEDRLAKTEGDWKFVRRKVVEYWQNPEAV